MPEPVTKYSINKQIAYPITNAIAELSFFRYITATCVTFIGGLVGIGAICAIIKYPCNYFLIFILLLVRNFLDILDGSVARVQHQESEFGSMLDKTIDASIAITISIIFIHRIIKHDKLRNNIPALIIGLIPFIAQVSELCNRSPGFWQDNDLIVTPIVYTAISYLTKNCT